MYIGDDKRPLEFLNRLHVSTLVYAVKLNHQLLDMGENRIRR